MNDLKTERERLVRDLNEAVADTRRIVDSMAGAGDEKIAELGERAERNLRLARQRADTLRATMRRRSARAVRAAERRVHQHPWGALAAAAAFGLALGVALDRGITHRRNANGGGS